MFSSLLQLALGLRDLSQTEKIIMLCKAKQIHKTTTIFTQNDNFVQPGKFLSVNLCQLYINTLCLRINYYVQKIGGHRSQWNSCQMNNRHPWQLKKN